VKRKSSVSAEAAKPPLEPVVVSDIQTPTGRVSPIVLAVVDRVGPLAQSTAGKVVPLAQNAAGRVNAAAVLVSPYAVNAAGRIVPLAHTAAGRITPLAQSAVERVGPYATQAVDRVTPLAQQAVGLGHQAVEAGQQAAGKVGPLAATAKQRGAEAAQSAVGAIGPKIDDALGRVAPAVEAARGKVNDDYLPRINDVLSSAAETPALVEATKRSRAAMAAARGELSLPEPKVEIVPQRSKSTSWLPKVALVAGVAGLVAFLVKKLLGDKDADWQAARPTTPYAPSRPASAQPKATVDSTTDNTASTSASGTPAPNATEAAASADAQWGESAHVLADEGDVAAVDNSATSGVTTETGQLDWDAALKQGPTTSTYEGEGVYVGAEPPQGFVVKGNERSMKYHTPESSGYSSTTAEVWFNSEEAAQQAGFSRAQS
jgi:hypothetical protein